MRFSAFVLFRIAWIKSLYWFHAATLAECVPVDRPCGGFAIFRYSNTFSGHFPFRMIFGRSGSLRCQRRSSLLLTACSWSLIHTSILHPLVFFILSEISPWRNETCLSRFNLIWGLGGEWGSGMDCGLPSRSWKYSLQCVGEIENSYKLML